MLPPPALSFTVPSIHDDLNLQCRVYHPACLAPTNVSQIPEWRKRAAIVAHPYAPLGGCYDDPIVDIVAATILRQGFIVGTFNFRGAGTSKGRTSWQSKAEQNDYISFIGFMIYYLHHLSPPSPKLSQRQPRYSQSDPELHDLSPVPSQALPPPHNDNQDLSPTTPNPIPQFGIDAPHTPSSKPRLLLAGYSYGAMILSALPPIIGSMIQPFQTPLAGSPHAEIRMRAACLADQQNELMSTRAATLLAQAHRQSRTFQHEDHPLSSPKIRKQSAGLRMGGEENMRRPSHDSHRSRSSFTIETPEVVRKSVDRVRSITKSSRFPLGRADSRGSFASASKKGSESESSIEHIVAPEERAAKPEEKAIQPVPGVGDGLQTAYLLVSPLHGWVSVLASMWSAKSREKDSQPGVNFTVAPTLALFGDDDVFVSAKRLRGWAEKLSGARKDGEACRFKYREVSGAGHFWHDYAATQVLQEEVKAFVASL